jgi:hypothetical protein
MEFSNNLQDFFNFYHYVCSVLVFVAVCIVIQVPIFLMFIVTN